MAGTDAPESVSTRALPAPGAKRRGISSFAFALALIALVGLGVRVSFAATRGTERKVYDAAFYVGAAHLLVAGEGFTDPLAYRSNDRPGEAAEHPPLTAIVLAPAVAITDDQNWLRIVFALVGTTTVVLVGLLGAAAAGRRVGLIAAGIAAVYPMLWVYDGVLMAESLAVMLTTAALVATFRLLERPTLMRSVAVGVLCGLAALARAELLLLGALLAIGFAARVRTVTLRRRALIAAVLVVAMSVVVSPWVIFNLTRFERPVFMTTDGEVNLLYSTCDATYSGPYMGSAHYSCLVPPIPGAADHSEEADRYRDHAVRYMRSHPARYPLVVLARAGRTWSLFRPMHDIVDFEGRPRWAMLTGLVAYYPLLLLAVGGAFVQTRRRRTWWPLAGPPIVVCAIALVSWGQPRYRAVAEPCIVVLAAVSLAAAAEWLRTRHTRRRVSATRPQPASVPPPGR